MPIKKYFHPVFKPKKENDFSNWEQVKLIIKKDNISDAKKIEKLISISKKLNETNKLLLAELLYSFALKKNLNKKIKEKAATLSFEIFKKYLLSKNHFDFALQLKMLMKIIKKDKHHKLNLEQIKTKIDKEESL
ncbi:hypothetical protein DID75_02385 [Candidatus Marinamargulisbacteria bacterium SCGC AG-410-N11]|nr:hypothetical protein DID75_02385 [Candidatus Marinamargulisbacteria bacterium SCGC AG-410-N11]